MLRVSHLQRLQAILPLNPQGFAGVTPDSSFNTAASFVTNTNWQSYVGEATMSYFTQMAGLAVQKIPEQLEIAGELPRNASGKVLKHELRARYAPAKGA